MKHHRRHHGNKDLLVKAEAKNPVSKKFNQLTIRKQENKKSGVIPTILIVLLNGFV